jgi:hypothetical protein
MKGELLMYSHCPKCLNHSLGIEEIEDEPDKYIYYCPVCDWESEKMSEISKSQISNIENVSKCKL